MQSVESVEQIRSFNQELAFLLVLLLPVMYIGIILAVISHEILGHGLVCALLGGAFEGFGIHIDGFGYAIINAQNLSIPSIILVLLGGLIVTTLLALICFYFSYYFRKKYLLSVIFLVLAYIAFMDSVPYFFYDAIFLGGIGDFSVIYSIYPNEIIRVFCIVGLGIFMVLSIIVFNASFINKSLNYLGIKKAITGKQRNMVFLFIFLLQVIGWASFDWNQLVPGVDGIPIVIGCSLTLLILIVIYNKSTAFEASHDYLSSDFNMDDPTISLQQEKKAFEPWKRYLAASWGICFLLVALILAVLQETLMF